MTPRELIWSLGFLGLLVLALQVFKRIRRRTAGYQVGRNFKERLPAWVLMFERAALYLLEVLIALSIFTAFAHVHPLPHPGDQSGGATVVFAGLGAILVAVPIAAFAANGVSWLVAPVRRANLQAMEGLPVSFGSLTRELLQFGAVSASVGIVALAIAALEPWAL